MGRREIINGGLLAVFGLGGAAFFAGLTTATTPYTLLLTWGGLAAMALSGAGFVRLMLTAPASATGAWVAVTPVREFLPDEITPRVLREKVENRTSVQITAITCTYAGKWLRYEGRVRDVSALNGDNWLLQMGQEGEMFGSVSAIFGKKWHGQLAALNKGDWVTVEGCIARLSSGVSLDPAEIIHIGKTPAQRKQPPAARKRGPRKPAVN